MAQRRTKRDIEKRTDAEDTRDTYVAEEERIPLDQQRDIMSAPGKEGFVRRWVNEDDRYGNRTARFQKAGWKPVTDHLPIGAEAVVEHNDSLGSILRKNVGGGKFAILMEIREEYFNIDQAKKAERDDAREASIKRTIGGVRDSTVYGETTTEVTTGIIREQKGHNVS